MSQPISNGLNAQVPGRFGYLTSFAASAMSKVSAVASSAIATVSDATSSAATMASNAASAALEGTKYVGSGIAAGGVYVVSGIASGALNAAHGVYEAAAPTVVSQGIKWYIDKVCTDNARHAERLNDLQGWLGTVEIEQMTKGLASLINPKSLEMSDEKFSRLVMILMHTLAKRSMKDNKTTVSDMIFTLTQIFEKHIPKIKADAEHGKFVLKTHSYPIMKDLVTDLVSALIPFDEFSVYGLTNFVDPTEAVVKMLATEKNLNILLQGIEAYDNVQNRKDLMEENPALLQKLDEAEKPMSEFVRKKLFEQQSKQNTIGDELFSQFKFHGDDFKTWWNRQVKTILGKYNDGGQALLSLVSHLTMQTMTNILLSMSGEKVGERSLDIAIDIVKFGAANQRALWNFALIDTPADWKEGDPDPNQANYDLFKPLAEILKQKLFLNNADIIPLPDVFKPFAVQSIEQHLPKILALSYAKGLLPDLKQLGAGAHPREDWTPTINEFSAQAGKFASHYLFRVFLPTAEGNDTVSKSIEKSVVDNPEYSRFIPHNQAFWSSAINVVGSNPQASWQTQLQDWVQLYTTHATGNMLQTLMEKLVLAESKGASPKLKESAVKLLNVYMNERKGVKAVRKEERIELLKSISHSIKEILEIDPADLPVPLLLQESLWDSWIPEALDQCIVKFLEPKYLRQKLAETIKEINLKESNYDPNSPSPIHSAEFEEICRTFMMDAALFAEIPHAKRALEWGLRDQKSYRQFITKALYGVLGNQLMEQLKNWDLSVVLETSLKSAIKSGAMRIDAPNAKSKPLDLSKEIMAKVDEALTLKVESTLVDYHKRIDSFIEKWFGSGVLMLKKILQVIVNIMLTPVVVFLWLIKKIAFYFIQNRMHFTLNKMENTFDVTLIDRLLKDVQAKLASPAAA